MPGNKENQAKDSDKKTTLTLTKLSQSFKFSLEKEVKKSKGRWDNLPDFIKHILTELDAKGIEYFIGINKLSKEIDGLITGRLKVVPVDKVKGEK